MFFSGCRSYPQANEIVSGSVGVFNNHSEGGEENGVVRLCLDNSTWVRIKGYPRS